MQRAGFLNRIVHVSCARRTKEETASAVFIIQLLLIYLFSYLFIFPPRADLLITARTAHNCTARHCIARLSYSTDDWRHKTTTLHLLLLLLFPHRCFPTDSKESTGAECSQSQPAKSSEICFALRRVPAAHLTKGDARASVSCSSSSSPPRLDVDRSRSTTACD